MTAQIPEKLRYERKELSLCTEPLEEFFDLGGGSRPRGGTCSALWRGYVGTWDIREGRLYLVDLSIPFPSPWPAAGEEEDSPAHGNRDGDAPGSVMERYFPGFRDRVFAHWYSGTLRAPRGKMLGYVHGGYGSTFEEDLLIAVEKGVVVKTEVRRNGTANGPEAPDGDFPAAMTLFAAEPGKEREGRDR